MYGEEGQNQGWAGWWQPVGSMEARWPRGSATQPSKQPNLPAPALPLPPRLPLVPPQASRPAEQAEQTRLQTQAFEAINEVVRSSAADTTPMVVQLIPLVVGKLQPVSRLPFPPLPALSLSAALPACLACLARLPSCSRTACPHSPHLHASHASFLPCRACCAA